MNIYGYINNVTENKIDLVPREIEAVKFLHDKFFSGEYPSTWSTDKKVGALVKEAKAKSFPVPPNGYWNKKAVTKILMDSIYSGVLVEDRIKGENNASPV